MLAAFGREQGREVIPLLRDCVDELLDQERQHAERQINEQMRSLELAVAKLESALPALQVALNIERSRALDLPNVLRN
jgi:hypothetical protein